MLISRPYARPFPFHVLCTLVLLGCMESESLPGSVASSTAPCPDGQLSTEGGVCQPAGLPLDMLCPPGETPIEGGCQLAGVPPEACGEGFEPDGAQGCKAILPAGVCPSGRMAVPGDAACRDVAPCGSGDYGDVLVDEATTQFVNATYDGTGSDGSREKPWKTVQQGIDAASPGAIVAVAVGTYQEDVTISTKSVRLWGRCPSMVHVVSSAGAAITVQGEDADGTEIHDIGLTGEAGLISLGATDILLDRIWVHDTSGQGIQLHSDGEPTQVTLQRSLVENAQDFGVYVVGGTVDVVASAIRSAAQGIRLERALRGEVVEMTVRGSLIEANQKVGIGAIAGDLTVEDTIVRDTQVDSSGWFGLGVAVMARPVTGERSRLTIRRSVIARSHEVGILIQGSKAWIEATVVRDTKPSATWEFGMNISAQDQPDAGEKSELTLKHSLLAWGAGLNLNVYASDMLVESTMVRDTLRCSTGCLGRGVNAVSSQFSTDRPNVILRRSVLDSNAEFGAFAMDTDMTVEATLVQDNEGGGLGADASSSLTVRNALVQQNRSSGLFIVGSKASIEFSEVRETRPSLDGVAGDSLVVQPGDGPALVDVIATHLHHNHRAGIANFGANVSLGSSVIVCNAFDLNGEALSPTGQGVQPFVFEDLGGNLCGCPEISDSCYAVSSNLNPPNLPAEL